MDRFCLREGDRVGGIMKNNILPPSAALIRKAFLGTKPEQAIYRREFYEALRRFLRCVQRECRGALARNARRQELAVTRQLRRMTKAQA